MVCCMNGCLDGFWVVLVAGGCMLSVYAWWFGVFGWFGGFGGCVVLYCGSCDFGGVVRSFMVYCWLVGFRG